MRTVNAATTTSADGRYVGLTPTRILDTRSTTAPAPGTALRLALAGAGGVPANGVSAVAMTVTATQSKAAGFDNPIKLSSNENVLGCSPAATAAYQAAAARMNVYPDGKAGVLETSAYQAARPDAAYATQSGPMLVVDGQLHPRFEDDGTSKFIRNGVGVRADGTVVLITNAPRSAASVQRQLRKLGVADDTYDAIVSSGDLTRNYVADHPGKSVFWLGPERDNSIHRGLDATFAPLESADYIISTGPFDDETETPEDYRAMMTTARQRGLTLVCANPDIVVERGDRLIYCAGAIAELYRELGGEVIFYGKPHRPIYERAMALARERRGHDTPLNRVLAIGDSVRTDLMGAHAFGIDLLFLTRGIHSEEFAGVDQLDPASIKELFGHPPLALMRELKW